MVPSYWPRVLAQDRAGDPGRPTSHSIEAMPNLPLKPPIEPQLARSRAGLPAGEQWSYEPKYDGFRAIVFVDGEPTMIQSRSGKPLGRYFPELAFPPGRYVVDGEIVIDDPEGGQDFDALQQRIHPAKSRIDMLAVETPARYVAFDLLALDDESWLEKPFSERRAELEALCSSGIGLHAADDRGRGGGAVAAQRRRRRGQGHQSPLPSRRAHRDDEDQTGADDRCRRRRVPPRQGAGHRRLADPRALRRRRQAARGRALLRPEGGREAGAGGQARGVRDRRPRPRRSQPLEEREGSRVDRAPARAGRRGHVRPRQRRADPPRDEDPALA